MNSTYSNVGVARGFDAVKEHIDHMFRGFGLSNQLQRTRSELFPPLNIGATEQTFEVQAYVPGIVAESLQVLVDKNVLSISGERASLQAVEAKAIYANERPTGKFSRKIELPQDADAESIQASYTDGCLTISIKKRESAKPRVIEIQ